MLLEFALLGGAGRSAPVIASCRRWAGCALAHRAPRLASVLQHTSKNLTYSCGAACQNKVQHWQLRDLVAYDADTRRVYTVCGGTVNSFCPKTKKVR